MIELKPSTAALTRAVNLSPVNPPRKRFATDFYGKFDGEPFRAATKSVKFKNKTRDKTLASPQIKFDPNANLNRVKNLTNQAVRTTNQTCANLTRSESSEAGVKFSFCAPAPFYFLMLVVADYSARFCPLKATFSKILARMALACHNSCIFNFTAARPICPFISTQIF